MHATSTAKPRHTLALVHEGEWFLNGSRERCRLETSTAGQGSPGWLRVTVFRGPNSGPRFMRPNAPVSALNEEMADVLDERRGGTHRACAPAATL